MGKLKIDIPSREIEMFCRKWRVKELSLFGSVLREDFETDSDIDVLVEFEAGHGFGMYEWVDMIEDLKNIFGREVDLVEKSAIRNPFRRKAIMAGSQVIHGY